MSFIKRKGRTVLRWFPKKASTAWNDGDAAIFDGSGYVTTATSSSTTLLGVHRKTIATTDSDYASTTSVPVEIPVDKFTVWEALTASAVATDIGTAVDLTDKATVNRGASSHHVVTIVEFISATKVGVIFNATYDAVAGA